MLPAPRRSARVLAAVGATASLLLLQLSAGLGAAQAATPPGVTMTSSATGPVYQFDVDCAALTNAALIQESFQSGGSIEITPVNCSTAATVMDLDVMLMQGAIYAPGGLSGGGSSWTSGQSATLIDGVTYTVLPNTALSVGNLTVFYFMSAPLADPAGVLLKNDSTAISAGSAPSFTVTPNSTSNQFDHNLGGISSCTLRAGEHVYSTLDIEITKAGDFTFRTIATSPLSANLYGTADVNPLTADAFLAVYSHFDPSNPDAGLVGCNDDLWQAFSSQPAAQAYTTSSGQLLGSQFPQFTATFQPGHYTLLLSSYTILTASDWVTNSYGPAAITYEFWGPTGGFDPVTVTPAAQNPQQTAAAPKLPSTGADVLPAAFAASALLAAGAAAILLSRRRRHIG